MPRNECLLGEYFNCHNAMRSSRLIQLVSHVTTLCPEQNVTFMYYFVITVGVIFWDIVYNLMYNAWDTNTVQCGTI